MSVYQDFESRDIVLGIPTVETRGLFSNNTGSLGEFWTSSTALDSQKAYYYAVYQTASALDYAASQFSTTYGHRLGSGSYGGGSSIEDSPTKAIYSQMRQLVQDPEDTSITYGADGAEVSTDQIYAIAYDRARYKQRVDPGNLQINLAELNGGAVANNVHTGSNVALNASNEIISLIDDSGDSNETGTKGRSSYNLVSGSIASGIYNSGTPVYYGKVHPSLGIVIIDANMLNASASFNSMTSSIDNISETLGGDNAFKLFTAISGAYATNNAFGMTGREAQTRTSTNYFIRGRADDFNYSNNPTYSSGSDAQISQASFVGDPKTYVTTVGLYDEDRQLLGVAKLSQPILKSFNREVSIKVRLDY